MAQAKIDNKTACQYETLFANDESFRPVVTPIIKATFDIAPDGKVKFAKEQIPVNLEGEFNGDPASSSYIIEPECAFTKPTTDVVVIGDAISSQGPVTHLLVEIYVGKLYKKLGIIGDRHWVKQSVGYAISEITPFETMPLIYENAFGGWDTRHEDSAKHGFEARNTVGKGFFANYEESPDGPMCLPNIENPDALIQDIKDKPAPTGCGFTLNHWQPRAAFAGTYDAAWEQQRSPLLPEDFNRRYFNGASEGLIAPQFLLGNESVCLKNMTPNGMLQFQLPGWPAPVCTIELADEVKTLPTNLDTVIINTKTMQLQLIWRNYITLAKSAHDVEAIEINYK